MTTAISKHENKIVEVLLLLIAFTLPFNQQASIFAIIALILVWIVQRNFLTAPIILKNNSLLLLWISYFILHLVGLLWSTNLHYGWLDIQTKLSFLIFPLVLGTLSISCITFYKIKRAFVAGTIIACIYCSIMAVINYSQTHDQTVFFYKFYSVLMHVTYFSIYITLSILFFLENVITKWKLFTNLKKTGTIIGIIYLVINIILLSARTAIATALIVILFYCIVQIIKYKKGTLLFVGSLVIIGLINYQVTQLYNRYSQVEEEIKTRTEIVKSTVQEPTEARTYNSTQSRIEFWKNAIVVIKQNLLFGVGTGDIKEELVNQYAKVNFQYGVENRFSPHNQYLHTGVILGVVGIALLLCCLLLPLRLAIQQRDWIYVCFSIIIILNAITESILERQNGIIFYAFFNVLFYIQTINTKQHELA